MKKAELYQTALDRIQTIIGHADLLDDLANDAHAKGPEALEELVGMLDDLDTDMRLRVTGIRQRLAL